MKTKMKHAVTFLLTVVLTVFLAQKVGILMDPEWSGDGLDAVKAFHSLEDNSLDVIVYGSSHAWKGCDTRVLRDKYHMAAYNYACNWQAINTSLLFLEDSLRTQSPKVVCIETYFVDYILQDVQMEGQIYYTREISTFAGKIDYLRQVFGNHVGRYVTYVFPLMMFHENWKTLNGENWLDQGPERFVESAGYMEAGNVTPCKIPDYKTFRQGPHDEDTLKILDRIVKVCSEKGTKIIFFVCPYIEEYFYGNAMKEYAEQNGCLFVDFFQNMDETGFDPQTDMNDGFHLNKSGAGKVADYLGKCILEHYGDLFEDTRGTDV